MDEHEKLVKAEALAIEIQGYGAQMISDATAKSAMGVEPWIVVRMKDGLSFNLPWDFSPSHLDTVFAVVATARVRGREEAFLEATVGGIPN